MSDFKPFAVAVNNNVLAMSATGLFMTNIDKDALWDLYLSSFPAGTNPLYRERTEHDCTCCKQFIRNIGGVVTIDSDLNVKIAGASSLPSIAAVQKKIAENKKLNAGDLFIANALKEYEAFVKSPMITAVPEALQKHLIENWIDAAAKAAITEVRALNKTLSKVVYGIVAGHGWFTDLDLEESTMEVEVDGVKYKVTAELTEKEIKI